MATEFIALRVTGWAEQKTGQSLCSAHPYNHLLSARVALQQSPILLVGNFNTKWDMRLMSSANNF
jgi:hypothetical protein